MGDGLFCISSIEMSNKSNKKGTVKKYGAKKLLRHPFLLLFTLCLISDKKYSTFKVKVKWVLNISLADFHCLFILFFFFLLLEPES